MFEDEFGDGLYDVPVNVNATGCSDYLCIVTIQHSTSEIGEYVTSFSVTKRGIKNGCFFNSDLFVY